MAHFLCPEGKSNKRPPLLLGSENYNSWKFRMEIFLKCESREWNAVENGITNRVDSCLYNNRAMDTLLRGMVNSEVNKILFVTSTTSNKIWCTTAKEIWDTLKKIHEGTRVKSTSKRLCMGHESYPVGQSINRPPLLLGSENYYLWKFRMSLYLKHDPREWDAVENGYTIPKEADGTRKSLDEFTQEELNSHSCNYRAMDTLLRGMVVSEENKISWTTSKGIQHTTAKEIWDTLKNIHEGTSRVKLRQLIHDYDVFKLEKDESINDAQTRLLTVVNSLALLNKRIPLSEINWKLLHAMPKRFAPIVNTLQDSSHISTMDTITLFGKLEEFEHQLKRHGKENEASRRKTCDHNSVKRIVMKNYR